MNINEARRIADLYNENKWKGFQAELREALKLLANHGNRNDRKLGAFLLDILD